MGIELYTKSGVYFTNIERILSCSKKDTLAGVMTLSFETLITDELERMAKGTEYTVLFENEYYDVISIQRSLSSGLYKIKFSCEHISYRLSTMSKKTFSATGTPKEILTQLLKDTGFNAGVSDILIDQTYSLKKESTIRSIILDFADAIDADIEFQGFYVNIYKHRGSQQAKELIDRNVVSISKTEKEGTSTPTYAITVRPTINLLVGDELHLKFTKLGIDENVRLIGITRKPYISKDYELEIGIAETSLEADLVSYSDEAVTKGKTYYGVKISEDKGLTITRDDNDARVIMNSDEFRMQVVDDENLYRDSLYFDPVSKSYRFKGSIEVDAGSININNKFKVDAEGNAHLTGESTIYGGKYYAGQEGEKEGYSQMTSGGYEVFNSDNDLKLRLGYTTEGEDYPFIQLGSGSGAYTDYGLVKKFTDGLWIGNSEPADESGEFVAMQGYNGIFFRFSDNTAFIVKDTNMKNIYTGDAIAKFG